MASDINVKIAKLITGEFVIGRLVDNLFLTNTLLIKFTANAVSGEIKKTLHPYMIPFSNNIGHIILLDKIMTFETADEEMINMYISFLKSYIENIKKDEVDSKNDN